LAFLFKKTGRFNKNFKLKDLLFGIRKW